MDENQPLADLFEEHRPRLQAVAYRMLGSLAEAEDAVQDTWLRLCRAGAGEIDNLGGWLTTVTARVCLNMLRARSLRREDSLAVRLPDPVISSDSELQPEEEALLADSIGFALLVVLDTLAPAERLAFVLHDMFDLPFEQIAPMVGRTPATARQLASRARRRVKGADIPADPDLVRQREAVDAFFSAAREGDFDALVAVLDPGVVLRIDAGAGHAEASMAMRGADAVARQALTGLASALRAGRGVLVRPVLVSGAAGVLISMRGRPVTVMGFTVTGGKIAGIDAIADPERVRKIATSIRLRAEGASIVDPAARDYYPSGDLRVSDADRDLALSELSEALRAGRITADEFDERSGQVLGARTGKELTALLADLPVAERVPAPTFSSAR